MRWLAQTHKVVGVVADILAILTLVWAFISLKYHDAQTYSIVYMFCGLFAVNLILLFLLEREARIREKSWSENLAAREATWERYAGDLENYLREGIVYAQAQYSLHAAYHKLRDAWFLMDSAEARNSGQRVRAAPAHELEKRVENVRPAQNTDAELDPIYTLLKGSAQDLAAAFGVITGGNVATKKCLVCIKELLVPGPLPQPETAAQGENNFMYLFKTKPFFASEDIEGRNGLVEHPLSEDEHLCELFSNPKYRWYTKDNIGPGFRCSSWDGTTGKLSSIAAWPIRKNKSTARPDLLGFLVVECQHGYTFTEEIDFHIGAAFADTLYPVFTTWKRLSF